MLRNFLDLPFPSSSTDQCALFSNLQPAPETSRRNRSTTANASALKVSCELLRIFITEAIQRSAFIAEAEGATVIEPTHLERVLPQLLLDF